MPYIQLDNETASMAYDAASALVTWKRGALVRDKGSGFLFRIEHPPKRDGLMTVLRMADPENVWTDQEGNYMVNVFPSTIWSSSPPRRSSSLTRCDSTERLRSTGSISTRRRTSPTGSMA